MLVLGIETSCDETAVAVIENGKRIYSNVVSSSLNFHRRYRGIIPEIASRLQLETINVVLADAIKTARVKLKDIDLIAVTDQPGLTGSLLVGTCFAQALSFAKDIPLIKINHLHAHLYASFFNRDKPKLPFVGLVVSGGHTSLFFVRRFSNIELLGRTQDDACGEAFDKVAAMLGLGYPGGPIIERLASKGNPEGIAFRCSNTKSPLNFSFSGIKTAVLYYIQGQGKNSRSKIQKRPSAKQVANIAASFQEAVINALISKAFLACKLKKTNQLVIGGGVAANNRLRDRFNQATRVSDLNIYFSPKQFCTDNAAMVAGLAYRLSNEAETYGAKRS